MSDRHVIVPREVADAVERYVDQQIESAINYANRDVLDASGVHELRRLVAWVYHLGFRDGETSGTESAYRDAKREAARARLRGVQGSEDPK